jgi:8-hydroxy-5-deazaflavin:NADPH oxidoreductase
MGPAATVLATEVLAAHLTRLAAVQAKGANMKIGIIGAGNIGSALTRRFTAAGHQVFVANSRGPQTLTKLSAETGATPVNVKEAAHAGEVVVVTIPEKSVSNLSTDLFKDVPASVVVIDTGNYYPRQRDGRIDAIENGMPESQWVAQQLGRPVVKAFNNIYAARLQNFGLPAGTTGRVAIPVAGDDPEAKAIVFRLVDGIGFDPVDAGSLAESWRQQPGTPVYGPDFVAAEVQRVLSQASRERPVEFRAEERKGASV